jgi:hypothetical protein
VRFGRFLDKNLKPATKRAVTNYLKQGGLRDSSQALVDAASETISRFGFVPKDTPAPRRTGVHWIKGAATFLFRKPASNRYHVPLARAAGVQSLSKVTDSQAKNAVFQSIFG